MAKYKARYGLSAGAVGSLYENCWRGKGLIQGCGWEDFDSFVSLAAETGCVKHAHLRRIRADKPYGPDNAFWDFPDTVKPDYPDGNPCKVCGQEDGCSTPCDIRLQYWNSTMEKLKKNWGYNMPTATMSTDAFNRLISCVKEFTQNSGSRKIYKYIRMEFRKEEHKVTAIAVDGYRLAVEHAVAECSEDFTVYVKGNIKLPKGKTAEISIDNDCIIKCEGAMFGWEQPDGDFLDWDNAIPKSEVQYEIGFNGENLLSALKAAKTSSGGVFKTPVILELRQPAEPIIIRTNENDVKMVMPIRVRHKRRDNSND